MCRHTYPKSENLHSLRINVHFVGCMETVRPPECYKVCVGTEAKCIISIRTKLGGCGVGISLLCSKPLYNQQVGTTEELIITHVFNSILPLHVFHFGGLCVSLSPPGSSVAVLGSLEDERITQEFNSEFLWIACYNHLGNRVTFRI